MYQIIEQLAKAADAGRQLLTFLIFGPRSVSWLGRLKIATRILYARNLSKKRSFTSFGEQLVLVGAILRIPREMPGVIAEFGCYKGLSTVAISIAARYAGRQVVVFDSFEGLPDPKAMVHQIAGGNLLQYQKGGYSASLEEVKSVVTRYGEINRVEFVEGFFSNTLRNRPADEKYALIFEDADLVESVLEVLTHAWPKLQDEGWFFSHEARDLEVVKLFFDDLYWVETHGRKAPGLLGVGLGLPIDPVNWGTLGVQGVFGSCLAGLVKRPVNSAKPAAEPIS